MAIAPQLAYMKTEVILKKPRTCLIRHFEPIKKLVCGMPNKVGTVIGQLRKIFLLLVRSKKFKLGIERVDHKEPPRYQLVRLLNSL